MSEITTVQKHHVWCNYAVGPVDECKQCKRLNEQYPMDNLTSTELAAKYFPDAIPRTMGEKK